MTYTSHFKEKLGGLLRIIFVKGRTQNLTQVKTGIINSISGKKSDKLCAEFS